MSVDKFESVVPLPIPETELKEVIEKAIDWALMHGIGLRSKKNYDGNSLHFAPFSLLPSPFPRREFLKATSLQVILNELMHRVAHNREFLNDALKETIQVDEFTGNLFKIYETVQDEGVAQKVSLGLLRSDYLGHTDSNNKIKQVEINAIASSFGGITSHFKNFNGFILQELGRQDLTVNLPENNAIQGLCEGMLEAWKIYGKERAAVLFIVEDVTYNICDQRFHEFELKKLKPGIKVLRKTLTQIANYAYLNPSNELVIDDQIIAVIYFRSGYEPEQYPTQKEWDARLLMERSQAIKCPSIQYHLVGTKKVQQSLARSGVLEMFLGDPRQIEAVRDVFTGLYSLNFDEFGDQAVQMALDTPERFVLKPQREGGGNNIYGDNIREAMLKMKDSKERTAWILMERIRPPSTPGYLIRPGGPELPEIVETVSELGVFGVVIGDSQKIFCNRQVGHTLRTKLATVDEGGVTAGWGALDSPYLIDI